jgi:hypothetical protein
MQTNLEKERNTIQIFQIKFPKIQTGGWGGRTTSSGIKNLKKAELDLETNIFNT